MKAFDNVIVTLQFSVSKGYRNVILGINILKSLKKNFTLNGFIFVMCKSKN